MDEILPVEEHDGSGKPVTATATLVSILVAYATRHGSTAEVAEAVAEELGGAGRRVIAKQITPGLRTEAYDAVVVGGPMIMGWHKDAVRFLKRNAAALAGKPTACFITAASLTQTEEEEIDGLPVFIDPWLPKRPRQPERLSRKERYASPRHYLAPILAAGPALRPRSVAFLGGLLDLTEMNILEKLFVLLAVGASPGDLRNWEAIRGWARDLASLLDVV